MSNDQRAMTDFKALRAAYPPRGGNQGWTPAERLVTGHIRKGADIDDILEGTKAYAKWCDHMGKTGTELVKQAQTFFGRDKWWAEDWSIPESTYKPRTVEVISDEQKQRDAAASIVQMEKYRNG